MSLSAIQRNTLLFLAMLSFAGLSFAQNPVATVSSPDGSLRIDVYQTDSETNYEIYKNGTQVVSPSCLGLSVSSAKLTNLQYKASTTTAIDESYSLPSGKVDPYTNSCNELKVEFIGSLGKKLNIYFRAYNEGAAFRYEIAGIENGQLTEELTEVNLAQVKTVWAQKYQKSYETTYDERTWSEMTALTEGMGSPLLAETTDGQFLLITEAANTGCYATSKLFANATTGSLSYRPVGTVALTIPFLSPWRVVMAGSLTEIVESTMTENLCNAASAGDWSWVKPGRASWNWGGEDADNVISYDIATEYVDMAAHMGWEYFLLDDGWESVRNGWNGAEDTRRIIDYARSQNVDVLLWANHNKFSADPAQIEPILNEWKSWGAKGVKIDFWEDDSQPMMQKYDAFLQTAADLQLVVDLHGCTRPSGLRRQWPNLLTSEAVWGGELYLGNRVKLPAKHNIMLALTRNVVGPMDYTPGEFATKWGSVSQLTSWAHQVALFTLYESGIQCYVDKPAHYRNSIVESFLKTIPAAWDETRLLEAQPEEFVTLARRKGSDWFVASIANQARTLQLPLDFLDAGKTYHGYIYKDGGCKAEIAFEYTPNLSVGHTLEIPILEEGGATILLSESPDLPKPWQITCEAEEVRTFGKKETDEAHLCSGDKYVSGLGRGNRLPFSVQVDDDGDYALTLFYMTDTDRNAYLALDGGEKLYHSFAASGGLNGKSLAMKTVILSLEAGEHQIEIGNESELAPNFDRITLKKVIDSTTSGVAPITADDSRYTIETTGNTLHVAPLPSEAICTVFTLAGQVHARRHMAVGEELTLSLPRGYYIVNIYTPDNSYSQKIIL